MREQSERRRRGVKNRRLQLKNRKEIKLRIQRKEQKGK